MLLSALLTLVISPLGSALLGGLIALGLSLWGRPRWARCIGALAVAWLGLWSLPPVSNWITLKASGPHGAIDEAGIGQVPAAQAIVLLGGGVSPAAPGRTLPDLNEAADRVWVAARLFRAGRAPVILASGGHDPAASSESEARAMQRLLIDLGVPRSAIILEERSRNTRQNASEAAKILRERGLKRVILVTSATHMARARTHFQSEGVQVYPVATDYSQILLADARRWIPTADALSQSARALKEWVGQLVW